MTVHLRNVSYAPVARRNKEVQRGLRSDRGGGVHMGPNGPPSSFALLLMMLIRFLTGRGLTMLPSG